MQRKTGRVRCERRRLQKFAEQLLLQQVPLELTVCSGRGVAADGTDLQDVETVDENVC